MIIDFPYPAIDGQVYTDPISLNVYSYVSASKSWEIRGRGSFVPFVVSMFQAREVLRRHNLLKPVTSFVELSSDDTLKIAWEYATQVERNGKFVVSLASQFGLDDNDLDVLFVEASKIEA